MARTPFIAANWKMHAAPSNLDSYAPQANIDIVVFPTFLDLAPCIKAGLRVGAQCGHPSEDGAHTGDISMKMIANFGCTHVLCGHSERRAKHAESHAFVAKQVVTAQAVNLHPILCIGETAEERSDGKEKEVVEAQLKTVLLAIQNSGNPAPLTVAYEPVWAIGTGNTATPKDAQEMHSFIRHLLPDKETRILYGGSMKPENAKELFAQEDIDGGLVGGASLDGESFAKIVSFAA